MSRIIDIYAQFFDGNQQPLSNGYLQFFQNESAIPEPTYNDPDENIGSLNPANVPLDGEGRLTLNVYGSVLFTVKIFNSVNVQQDSADNVRARGAPDAVAGQFAPWSSVIFYNIPDKVTGSDGLSYQSLSNNNIDNDPTSTTGFWKEILSTLWEPPENSDFNMLESKSYNIDGSANTVDASLPATLIVGEVYTAHSESISTFTVRILNPIFTIKGAGGTLAPGDNLILEPGDTAKLVARSTLILEVV